MWKRFNRPTGVAVGIVVAGLVWVLFPSSDTVEFGPDCAPLGLKAELSAMIHGSRFWRAQLAAAMAERDELLAAAGRQDLLGNPDAVEMSPIEQRMARLSHEQQQEERADKERRQAEATRRHFARLGLLMQCESAIRARLAP